MTNALITNASLPFTTALTRADSVPVYVALSAANTTASVNVLITGTFNLVGQTESVVLAPNTYPRSSKKWSTITQVSCASAFGGTISANAIYGSGQPALTQTLISSSLRGRLRYLPRISRALIGEVQGEVLEERWIFYCNSVLLSGDILVTSGFRYRVESVPQLLDQIGFHHIEAFIRRLD